LKLLDNFVQFAAVGAHHVAQADHSLS
jgi:hypothetical protein